jgi:predicted metal-binding protein
MMVRQSIGNHTFLLEGTAMKESVRRVRLNIGESELKKDLERYCSFAIEQGASDAFFVAAKEVPIDDRVALKCCIPKCFGYATCANCPPYSLTPDETRKMASLYRYAVALKLDVLPGVIVRDRETIKERVESYKKVFDMVNLIESESFYDGYYLSVGFAAGSCKSTFCYNVECTVLKGEKCRLALRARPSMEAVGIDCYRLATERGWEILPIGSGAEADCVSHGTLMGIVFID